MRRVRKPKREGRERRFMEVLRQRHGCGIGLLMFWIYFLRHLRRGGCSMLDGIHDVVR
jgi:hypothetical protein